MNKAFKYSIFKRKTDLQKNRFYSNESKSRQIWAWGDGAFGQLGNGSVSGYSGYPFLLDSFSESKIISIECGHYHSLALLENGSLYSWGWAAFQGSKNTGSGIHDMFPSRIEGELLNEKIVQMSGGRRHSCVITVDKKVYSWGIGENNQLGLGDVENRSQPTLISSLFGVNPVKVKCGWGHNVLLSNEGRVYTWGFGESGCLGHGNLESKPLPTEVIALKGINIVDVEAGSDFSLFLDDQGIVYYCGNLETTKKSKIQAPEVIRFQENDVKIAKMSSGLSHSLFISTKGELYSYGWNSDGQLGIGNSDPMEYPVHVSTIEKKTKLIGCGRVHSVCVTEDDAIYTWGNASRGRLGNGQVESEHLPSYMEDSEIEGDILSVRCGQDHTLLLTETF